MNKNLISNKLFKTQIIEAKTIATIRKRFISDVMLNRSKLSPQTFGNIISKIDRYGKNDLIKLYNQVASILYGSVNNMSIKKEKSEFVGNIFPFSPDLFESKKKVIIDNSNTYHMQVNIEVEETFKANNKKYMITLTESKIVKAKTLQIAQNMYKEDIEDRYTTEKSPAIYVVKKITFISMLNINDEVVEQNEIDKIRMKKASVSNVDYDHIVENKNYLDNADMCVINNIVGYFAKEFTINKTTFIELCSKYYNTVDKVEYQKASPLDYGLDKIDDNITWKPEDGVSSACLQWFCQQKNISHYGYDILNKCYIKNKSTNRNYSALCYYNINDHMYLITDKKLRESMMKRAAEINTSVVKTSLIDEFKTKNIFNDLEIFENVEIKNIVNYNSCIFLYSKIGKGHINDELYEVIKLYKKIPNPSNITCFNKNISKFSITINNILYYFVVDPSDIRLGVSYKEVRDLCEKNEIEFKNQSFTSFLMELKNKFLDMKNKRHGFTEEERKQILKRFKGKCNYCKKKVLEFEIDHIRSLANGGNNDDNNLQVLCKSCHEDKCQTEIENGSYNKIKDSESTFNKNVADIMNNSLSKSYAFIEHFSKRKYNNQLYCIDTNKCRSNILYYGKHKYPCFSVMDRVIKYNGECGAGVYYIETNNYLPLRGNGWYYYPVVEYCLNNNIIESSQIKYTIQSSFSIESNYYNQFIDYCRSQLGSMAKLAINSIVGCFNFNKNNNVFNKTLGILKGDYRAYNSLFTNNDKNFINAFTIDDDVYYHMFEDMVKINMETDSPIYNQIVQVENIMMHELKIIIEKKGGNVVSINTDCCYCEFPNEFPLTMAQDGINIEGYYFSDNVYKYKLEIKDGLKIERSAKLKRTTQYVYKKDIWTMHNDVEDNDFKPLVDVVVNSNKSFNILGRAGCGKSTLIKQIQKQLTKNNKKYISLCPTNKAALIIPEAETIHKFKNKMTKSSYLKDNNIEYVFIDEISMVHEIFYKFFMVMKKFKSNIKFIISGDYDQLSPVLDRYHGTYKESGALYELCDGQRIELSKCRRADDELYSLCKDVESVRKDMFQSNYEKINLCYTNEKRIKINRHFMNKMMEKNNIRGLYLPKLKFIDNSQDVNLFINMPIISYKNCKAMDIVNNESFKITNIDNEYIEFGNKRIKNLTIGIEDFQKFFFVSYAITIHKSQGDTIKKSFTIHEWDKLDSRLKYVALSRATTCDHINII